MNGDWWLASHFKTSLRLGVIFIAVPSVMLGKKWLFGLVEKT